LPQRTQRTQRNLATDYAGLTRIFKTTKAGSTKKKFRHGFTRDLHGKYLPQKGTKRNRQDNRINRIYSPRRHPPSSRLRRTSSGTKKKSKKQKPEVRIQNPVDRIKIPLEPTKIVGRMQFKKKKEFPISH
jgi:hypothetical protein